MSTAPPTGGTPPAYPDRMPTYLTLEQAAERAGVSTDELVVLFRQADVKGALLSADGRWVITEEALDAWRATRP